MANMQLMKKGIK